MPLLEVPAKTNVSLTARHCTRVPRAEYDAVSHNANGSKTLGPEDCTGLLLSLQAPKITTKQITTENTKIYYIVNSHFSGY